MNTSTYSFEHDHKLLIRLSCDFSNKVSLDTSLLVICIEKSTTLATLAIRHTSMYAMAYIRCKILTFQGQLFSISFFFVLPLTFFSCLYQLFVSLETSLDESN